MKKIIFMAAMMLAICQATQAQFMIEHKDGTVTSVKSDKMVFGETSAADVPYEDIASISRDKSFTVTFESCELPASGCSVNDNGETSYEEAGISFLSKGLYYMYSGAFVSSKSETCDTESESYSTCSEKTVITTDVNKPAGAEGSEKFSIFCYNPSVATGADFKPEMKFVDGSEHAISSLWVNNVAAYWQKCKMGYYSREGFKDGDYFDIIFTGYDAEGNVTGSVTVPMADYRDGKTLIISEWTKVDLSALGSINRLEVTANLCEQFLYVNYNTEQYGICIDNITFSK